MHQKGLWTLVPMAVLVAENYVLNHYIYFL